MFKYSDKQDGGLGSAVSSSSGLWDGTQTVKAFFGISAVQKKYLMATIIAIFVCINMSICSQKLLFASMPDKFQDFPGRCK